MKEEKICQKIYKEEFMKMENMLPQEKNHGVTHIIFLVLIEK